MPISTLYGFVSKYGIEKLFLFQELLDKKKNLQYIGSIYHLSPARLCRIKQKLFQVHHDFTPMVKESLRIMLRQEKENAERNIKKINVVPFRESLKQDQPTLRDDRVG